MRLDKTKYGWWKNAVFYQIYPKSFQDTNGDGIKDKTDRYGYAANWYYSDAWCAAFDIPITGKAADGSLEIKLMQEKTYDALTKVYQLYFENEGYKVKTACDGAEGVNSFKISMKKFTFFSLFTERFSASFSVSPENKKYPNPLGSDIWHAARDSNS